ncbi:MAG: hypothetical protein RLO18_27145, partial [Gimesia chilikensis]
GDDDDRGNNNRGNRSKRSDNSSDTATCMDSGLVLNSGSYKNLELSKGDRRDSTTLYLSGGVYSFDSITMEEYSSIVALDSSLILVATNMESDKGASIVPADNGNEGIEIIVMIDGQDVISSRRGDDDDDDDDDERDGRDKKQNLKIKHFAVSLDRENVIFATIYAANGSIELGKRSLVEGALIAENIDIGEEVIIRFDGDI